MRGVMMRVMTVAAAVATASAATVTVDPETTLRSVDDRMLLGVNAALWDAELVDGSLIRSRSAGLLAAAGMDLVRIPGGSWSDAYFWNGNGVRQTTTGLTGKLDRSKYVDQAWEVDYSAVTPGFAGYWGFPKSADEAPPTWHGIGVEPMHEFAVESGGTALVTVNVGTGRAVDAAEWVRWANQVQGYDVAYWEIGNEAEGKWAPGHLKADGTVLTAEDYAARFAEFATAMKAVDPLIKICGPVCGEVGRHFIEPLIEHAGDHVDVIAYHEYYAKGKFTREELFAELDHVGDDADEIRGLIAKHQPERVDDIEIILTEFHSMLHQDERSTSLDTGLWLTAALAEMKVAGIDAALLWDLFATEPTQGGGHGLLSVDPQTGGVIPRSAYWSFYIHDQLLGDGLLATTSDSAQLRAYAAPAADGGVRLLLVNTSDSVDQPVTVAAADQWAPLAVVHRWGRSQYVWNRHTMLPDWSRAPERGVEALRALRVPARSVCVVELAPRVTSDEASLVVLGMAGDSVVASGGSGELRVAAVAADGSALAGVPLTVTSSDWSSLPTLVQTDDHGIARLPFSAGADKTMVTISGSGEPLEHELRAVVPQLRLFGPDQVRAGRSVGYRVYATYPVFEDGIHLMADYAGPVRVVGCGDDQTIELAGGEGSVTLSPADAGIYAVAARAADADPLPRALTTLAVANHTRTVIDFSDPALLDLLTVRTKGVTVHIEDGALVIDGSAASSDKWQIEIDVDGLLASARVARESLVGVACKVFIPPGSQAYNCKLDVVGQGWADYWHQLGSHPLWSLYHDQWHELTTLVSGEEDLSKLTNTQRFVLQFASAQALQGVLRIDDIAVIEQLATVPE
ncbi:MAG: hypothetical protein ACYTF0_02555 [Planctomycetota bacterium]|jgi:hypothetical protein